MKEDTSSKDRPTLKELYRAADEARERVSRMSDEERAELLERANEMIRKGRQKP